MFYDQSVGGGYQGTAGVKEETGLPGIGISCERKVGKLAKFGL